MAQLLVHQGVQSDRGVHQGLIALHDAAVSLQPAGWLTIAFIQEVQRFHTADQGQQQFVNAATMLAFG